MPRAAAVLGNGTTGGTFNTPGQVSNVATWKTVSVGDDVGCAVEVSHAASCWGGDLYGQLGHDTTGSSNDSDVPVIVGPGLIHF